jgi:hypothetical protein
MKARPWLFATLTIAALAGWRSPTPPAPRRYRISVKTTQTVDLSGLGGGEQKNTAGFAMYVAVSIDGAGAARTVQMVIDSMVLDSLSQIPKEMAAAVGGTRWSGALDPKGRIADFKQLGDTSAAGAALLMGLRNLLPAAPPGRKPGDQWSDTTDLADKINGGEIATRTVTSFVAAQETVEGQKALKVATASSSSISGTQPIQGQDAAIEGTATGTSTWFFAGDGILLSSTTHQEQQLTLAGGFAPQPIPINVVLEQTVQSLR